MPNAAIIISVSHDGNREVLELIIAAILKSAYDFGEIPGTIVTSDSRHSSFAHFHSRHNYIPHEHSVTQSAAWGGFTDSTTSTGTSNWVPGRDPTKRYL